MNKDLEMEEMQIINKAQGGKLQIAEKSLRIEIESLQTQVEQVSREKEDLQQEYTNLGVKHQDLSKRFNDMQTKFIQTKDECNRVKNDLSTKTEYYEKQIQALLSETSEQKQQIQAKDSLIVQLNLQVEALTQEKHDLLDGLRDFETQLAYLKKPDAHEQTMNRQIQDLIRKQDKERVVSDDVETQKKLQKQKDYYEKLIAQLQKKLLEQERRHDDNISNISSNISKLVDHSASIPDDVNSDVSVFHKQELYAGHYALMKNQKLDQMNSDVASVLESDEQKANSENFRDLDSKVSVSQSLIQSEDKLLQAPKQKRKDIPTPKLS